VNRNKLKSYLKEDRPRHIYEGNILKFILKNRKWGYELVSSGSG
jgi:hypothetical protein